MQGDQLIFDKQLKDGRVVAINSWRGGAERLVYQNREAFERAKVKVEELGEAPVVGGYTTTT